MEPLKEAVQSEVAKEKTAKVNDRASLGQEESEKVERWLLQITQSSKGYLELTKSDVVNFLVRQRSEELTPKELAKIRADHYDPIRHITWIAPQIKAALNAGDMGRVADLQAELRRVELFAVRSFTKKNGDVSGEPKVARKKGRKSKTILEEPDQVVRVEDTQLIFNEG